MAMNLEERYRETLRSFVHEHWSVLSDLARSGFEEAGTGAVILTRTEEEDGAPRPSLNGGIMYLPLKVLYKRNALEVTAQQLGLAKAAELIDLVNEAEAEGEGFVCVWARRTLVGPRIIMGRFSLDD